MRQISHRLGVAGTMLGALAFIAVGQPVTKQVTSRAPLQSVSRQAVAARTDSARRLTAVEREAMAAGARTPVMPAAAVGSSTTSRRADSPETRIYFAVNPQDNDLHPAGAYWIDINDPSFKYHRIGDSKPNATKGGVAVDDIYYATQVYSSPLKDWTVLWNLADSLKFTGTVYDGVYQLYASDAAYDPWTDRIIGSVSYNYAQSSQRLAVIDYDRHQKQYFGPEYAYGTQMLSLAAGPECYYGIDYNNNFYTIDKFTGQTTLLGQTGLRANQINNGSMVYEPRTAKIYYTAEDNDRGYLSSMFVINPTTGKVERTLWQDTIRERRHGMWVDELTTKACPGLATGLTLDFAVGKLDGKLTFTAPAATWGGEQASGQLKYTILANGRQVGAGTTDYGATQTVDITLPGPGSYKFSVKTENSAGPSRWARTEAALGFEEPAAPQASMTYDGGKFTVNWKHVSTSATGAPLDTAEIAYRLTRYPDATVVAENLRDTVYEDIHIPGDTLATYYYGVQAIYGGVAESRQGLTNTRTFGCIHAPWREDFANWLAMDAFTIINANKDTYTWKLDSIYGNKHPHIYGYNKAGMDDWLITPPARLEPGYFYKIQYAVSNLLPAYNTPERVRLLWGSEPSVEGMTNLLCDTTGISSPEWINFGDYMKVDAAGNYYFGLHAVSNAESHTLSLRDVSLGAPVPFKAPGFATDAKIRSGYDDAQNVDISFVTPATRADGTPIGKIDRLEVMRGDTLVITYANPRPGTPVHCTDMVSQRGRNYTYTIVAYNEAGRGKELVVEDFIGIRKPAAPAGINGWEKDGKITLTWDAPATDELGNALNPDHILYKVEYRADEFHVISVADSLKANTITFPYTIDDPDNQQFLAVSVTGITEGGTGDAGVSFPIALGNPHSVPMVESFVNCVPAHPVGVQRLSGDAEWKLFSDASFSDLKSYDMDGGMIGMQAQSQGAAGMMTFAKIDMTKMKKPVLSFYVYNIAGNNTPDNNEYSVMYNDGTGFRTVCSAKVSDCANPGWNKVTVPMTDAKGKVIQLALKATTQAFVYSLFDNFRLSEQLAYNLGISDFSAPSAVVANTPAALQVKVDNNGENDASGFSFDIYRDSRLYMQHKVEGSLASGATALYSIPVTFTSVDPDEATFMVELSYGPDMDIDDNISGEVKVRVAKTSYPVPVSFSVAANAGDTGADLRWSAPQFTGITLDAVTEGFETAAAWDARNASDWTLVNLNDTKIGGANGITFPGGIQGSNAGFFTFRYGDPQFNQSWLPYGGDQMLISVYAADGSRSDAWAISPELSGKAQTVSLRARSYDDGYPESFRVMYSTTDNKPGSFKEAKSFNNISKEWTLYSANLPEGARYMAVNGISQDKFMLFIDDITYVPGGTLDLKGYHVYRDGKRLTGEPLAATSYADIVPQGGTYGYQVTAMYDRGESRPTELKSITVSSVNTIPAGVQVYASQGEIVVEGAEGMAVKAVSAAGTVLFSGKPDSTLRLPVATGVYLVQVGNAAIKLMVK